VQEVEAPGSLVQTLTITFVPREEQRAHLLSRAASARVRAKVTSLQSQQLVLQSRVLRRRDGCWPRFFALQGRVGEHSVRASWSRGHLLASRELLRRAEMLVDLNERFVSESGRPMVEASLDDPVAALLTLIRSCDDVKLVTLGPLSTS
jgi:hypothetical protein